MERRNKDKRFAAEAQEKKEEKPKVRMHFQHFIRSSGKNVVRWCILGFEITKNILSCDRAQFRAWAKYFSCTKKSCTVSIIFLCLTFRKMSSYSKKVLTSIRRHSLGNKLVVCSLNLKFMQFLKAERKSRPHPNRRNLKHRKKFRRQLRKRLICQKKEKSQRRNFRHLELPGRRNNLRKSILSI